MYTYYFRSPNQDEVGRIIVEVVRKSLYYFKGFFNNRELNLLQARPGKEILPPIDVAKSCQKLVAQVYGEHFTDYILCWLSKNPGLHFYLQGESEFHHGDFGAAIQYFSIALTILENFPTSPPQLTVKALLRRAQCFFILVRL